MPVPPFTLWHIANTVSFKDVPVTVPDTPIPLDKYFSAGLQPHEEELPEDKAESKPSFVPNTAAMAQLEGMGFPQPRCIRALHATGNNDAETAMNWLFQHMEDPDIDAPLDLSGGSGGASRASAQADPEHVMMIISMGFSEPQAKKALKETSGNVERAVDWLFSHPDDMGLDEDSSMGNTVDEATSKSEKELPGDATLPANFLLHSIVCHKGTSIHAGYVLILFVLLTSCLFLPCYTFVVSFFIASFLTSLIFLVRVNLQC